MKKGKRLLMIILGAVSVLTCLVMIKAMFHARMSLDDYGYVASTHLVWVHTHSFMPTLTAAVDKVISTYQIYQGSFIAIFFYAFNSAVIDERLYWIALLIHFALFVFSVWRMSYAVFRCGLKAKPQDVLIVFFLVLGFSLNFVPDTTDAFYAFNLCSIYTGFYSILLIAVSYLLESLFLESGKKRIRFCVVMACIFGFLAGGGHLCIAAMSFVTALFFTVYAIVYRKERIRSVLLVSVLMILSDCINMFSPGYHGRVASAGVDYGMNPVSSIFFSFVHSLEKINDFMTIYTLVAAVILLVIAVRSITSNPCRSYRHPLLFTFAMFSIFASMFAANYYALGSALYPRLAVVAYFFFYWMTAVIGIYWIGWLDQKHHESLRRFGAWCCSFFDQGILVNAIVLFGALSVCILSTGKLDAITCINIGRRLLNGEADAYTRARDEWIETFLAHKGEDVTVHNLPVYFDAIDKWHIGIEDGYDWVIGPMAEYYELKSLRVIMDEE